MTTTQTTPHMVRWGSLCRGDTIVCPGNPDLIERVERSETRPGNKRWIRTNHHDHVRLCGMQVERRP